MLDALSSSPSAAVPAGGARCDAQVGATALRPPSLRAPSRLGSPQLARSPPLSRSPDPRSPQGRPCSRGCRAEPGPGGSAALRLPEQPQCPALALAPLPPADARSRLQALVFSMAGCIESLERRLEGPRWVLDEGRTSRSCHLHGIVIPT